MRPKRSEPLSADDVRMIRRAIAQKVPRRDVAKDFGVLKSVVDRIALGDTYAWVVDNPEDEIAAIEPLSPIEEHEAALSMERILKKVEEQRKKREEGMSSRALEYLGKRSRHWRSDEEEKKG